ncbi:hypothetical protein DRH27_00885 [Candidatus Falkowbacteria bacterium]|nr:MAG: hypothetical protein DRH27_00885 [Candidatus Falkowbacteria bacterium]
MKFIIGIILLVIGLLIVIKSEWMLNNFGRIGFFDRKLGTEGGSRLGYKLVGMLFIFLGVLCVTGLIGGFMSWLTAPLTKYTMPN